MVREQTSSGVSLSLLLRAVGERMPELHPDGRSAAPLPCCCLLQAWQEQALVWTSPTVRKGG